MKTIPFIVAYESLKKKINEDRKISHAHELAESTF
jgi:hypothetical protein